MWQTSLEKAIQTSQGSGQKSTVKQRQPNLVCKHSAKEAPAVTLPCLYMPSTASGPWHLNSNSHMVIPFTSSHTTHQPTP